MTARERPLVLLVEDYEDTLDILTEGMTAEGFDVATATSGYEAIDKATELLPDIVLMDLSLPEMDGWEATRRLKADPRTRDICIVALTAHALDSHAERASEVGCDAFVTKPFLLDQLIHEVRRLLSQRATEAERG